MQLKYIQRKSSVSSIVWILGCGLGMTYYPIHEVYVGYDLGNTIWLLRRGEAILCGDSSTHIHRLNINFQEYLIKHPQHASHVKNIYVNRVRKFNRFINRLATVNYCQVSSQGLWADYQKIIQGYAEVYPYSEPFSIAVGDLSNQVRSRFLKKGLTVEQFETLLLPDELSFMQKEYLALLKIVLANKGRKISQATIKKIKVHQMDYEWLPYDYGVTSYSVRYFYQQVEALLKKEPARVQDKFLELQNYSRLLKKEQRYIINRFKLNASQLALIQAIRISFELGDAKKELFTRCHWYANRLFSEIARRLRCPQYIAAYLLPAELAKALLNGGQIDQKKIRARFQQGVIKISNHGLVKLYLETELRRLIDNFFNQYQKTKDLA